MGQAITNISVEILKVHPRNEEFFDDIQGEEYERFKHSIEEDGLLSPLIVAPDMTIISGHQRLKACRELGYKTVPVIIQEDVDDEDGKLRKLIAANFGRLKNDPIKQGKLIVEYEKLCGIQHGGDRKSKPHNAVLISQESVAKAFGVSVDTVQRLKELGRLSPDLQQIISDGRITPTTGFKVLAKLSDEEQAELIQQLPAAQKFSQVEVQEYVDKLKEKDNIIAGYKAKEKSEKTPDNFMLIDENEALKAEQRKWYERAQQYKKEAEAAQKKASDASKQTIIEKAPDDYENILEELARTKEELKRANFVLDNREDAPNIAKKFDVDSLNAILRSFSMDIGIYQYIDDTIAETSSAELNHTLDLIDEITTTLTIIKKKMEDNVA